MSALNEQEQKEVKEAYNILEEIEQSQKDENINKIFFKKYKAIKLIAESSFGSVYEGIDIKTKNKVAIKLEDRIKFNLLEKEAYLLFTLKGYGIVELLSFGRNQKYNILVQPLLGDSLYKLFLTCKKKFTLKDICLIGLQCLDRIEWIHKKNIIHRDIKPDNFLIGLKDPRIIYLIDFGQSKKYRSGRTLKHIQFRLTKRLIGTARYASINALEGFELSRRDDLESFCYMIIYFLIKKLPWQGVKAQSFAKRNRKICESKDDFIIDEYKDLIPNEFSKIFKYVKRLKFNEEPNYNLIRNAFKKILNDNNYKEDEIFSWIKDKKVLNLKKVCDINRRKSSSKKRIIERIYKLEEAILSAKKGKKNHSVFFSDPSISNNQSISVTVNNRTKNTENEIKFDSVLNKNKIKSKIFDNNKNIYNSLNIFSKGKKDDISTSISRRGNHQFDYEDSYLKPNSVTRQNNILFSFSPTNLNTQIRNNKNCIIASSMNNNNLRKNKNNKPINTNACQIRTKNLINSNFLINETKDIIKPQTQTNYKMYKNNFNLLKVNDNKYHKINNLKLNNKKKNNIINHYKISSTPHENIQIKYKFKNNNKLAKNRGFDNSINKMQYLNYNDNYYL